MYNCIIIVIVLLNHDSTDTCEPVLAAYFRNLKILYFLYAVAPGPVVNIVNDSSTSTTVTLSWTFGFDGNAEIAGVNISYIAIANYGPSDDGAARGSVSTTDGGLTSIIINGLQPLTTYEFTVKVRNTVSDKVGMSSPVSVTADTLPLGECTVHVLKML